MRTPTPCSPSSSTCSTASPCPCLSRAAPRRHPPSPPSVRRVAVRGLATRGALAWRYNRAFALPAWLDSGRSRFAVAHESPHVRRPGSAEIDRTPANARPTCGRRLAIEDRQAGNSRQLPAPSCRRGEELFPGIVGYDDTVIPEINIALLAQHDMLFLGEKGQAKSRLMRLVARFLDEAIPYLDDPGDPAARRSVPADHQARPAARGRACRPTRCRSPGGRATSATPSGWPRAPSSPTSSARSTRPSWPAA